MVMVVAVRETQGKESKAGVRQGWASCGDYTSIRNAFLYNLERPGTELQPDVILCGENETKGRAGAGRGPSRKEARQELSRPRKKDPLQLSPNFLDHTSIRYFGAHTLTNVFLCIHA